MSFAALAIVIVHLAMYGVVPAADDGFATHLFQLLMVAQVPIVGCFIVTWLPRAPWRTLNVLTVQFGAALWPLSPSFFLHNRLAFKTDGTGIAPTVRVESQRLACDPAVKRVSGIWSFCTSSADLVINGTIFRTGGAAVGSEFSVVNVTTTVDHIPFMVNTAGTIVIDVMSSEGAFD